jgi:hypothetical protein
MNAEQYEKASSLVSVAISIVAFGGSVNVIPVEISIFSYGRVVTFAVTNTDISLGIP